MCPAEKSSWGPRWTSDREGSANPAMSRAGPTGECRPVTHSQGEFLLRNILESDWLALFCLTLLIFRSLCLHTYMSMYSINRNCVMLCSIVWSCCGRMTSLESGLSLSYQPFSPCSATATRPHSSLNRQTNFSIGTDQLFNWTLDRLICSVSSLALLWS